MGRKSSADMVRRAAFPHADVGVSCPPVVAE
jgi:hypothetical protein